MSFQTNMTVFLFDHQRTLKGTGVWQKQTMHHKSVNGTHMQYSKPSEVVQWLSVRKWANIFFSAEALKYHSVTQKDMLGLTLTRCTIFEPYMIKAEIWEPWSRRCSANQSFFSGVTSENLQYTAYSCMKGLLAVFGWSFDTSRCAMCLVLWSTEESYKRQHDFFHSARIH